MMAFGVIVFPDFAMMSLTAIVEPLRAANALLEYEHYSWRTFSSHGGHVTASSGLMISTEELGQLAPGEVDRLIICAGHVVPDAAETDVCAALQELAPKCNMIGAVAEGSFVLARSGLATNVACALHWSRHAQFQNEFPTYSASKARYILTQSHCTSAGGVGTFDMMVDLIERDFGEHLSNSVAEWFIHGHSAQTQTFEEAGDADLKEMLDPIVRRAIELVGQSGNSKLEIVTLCQQLGVSQDRLEKLFKRDFGMTPSGYFRLSRLKQAHHLITNSNMSIREIAVACGYVNLSAFSRAFREVYGQKPSALRSFSP